MNEFLKQYTKKGCLSTVSDNGDLVCSACAHRCRMQEGREGLCGMRYNNQGEMMVPFGYVSALSNDPIEKKPFYHVYPGMRIMSFGMLGCNFHCSFCQNWEISQGRNGCFERNIHLITAKGVCDNGEAEQSQGIAATYNEPLITSEWAVEIFKEAKSRGMATCGYVSNGYATPEVIDYIQPWVDCYNIDLKSFSRDTYKKMGGNLDLVLESIALLYKKNFWVEIVTLVVPGLNDSSHELTQMAEFIASLSSDIPWHITAFHPDFKLQDRPRTSPESLKKAYEIGKKAGLHFIYPGNIPGQFGELEHTCCPECGTTLIERYGFQVLANRMQDGRCFSCNYAIPGLWRKKKNRL